MKEIMLKGLDSPCQGEIIENELKSLKEIRNVKFDVTTQTLTFNLNSFRGYSTTLQNIQNIVNTVEDKIQVVDCTKEYYEAVFIILTRGLDYTFVIASLVLGWCGLIVGLALWMLYYL
ncbi:MAG: hypothetical protein ATN33_01845 [Epulopiscium sp. Nele67-Bin001]|nr:MAG: hypothetical protein BEN18_05820 [Epulopiscium sp. Nuni2H_MBin001]OON91025.1 MAG: hypothetical protein ATN33_01845 [Epulopiscium sp. Nele67-Bin001]